MTLAYVDSSVLLRIALGEPQPLPDFERLTPISSVLLRVECLRSIERYRQMQTFNDETVAERRQAVLELMAGFRLVELTSAVLERAADPFPTFVATLDAIHLATAIEARTEVGVLTFATHDLKLASAAKAAGFQVVGAG